MNLKLYSSYGCPRCTHLKKILNELDIDYEELDIDKNNDYRKELNQKMGNADRVPVLEMGEKIVHIGYGSKRDIKEKIDKK